MKTRELIKSFLSVNIYQVDIGYYNDIEETSPHEHRLSWVVSRDSLEGMKELVKGEGIVTNDDIIGLDHLDPSELLGDAIDFILPDDLGEFKHWLMTGEKK